MASKTTHFKGFSVVDADIKIKINLTRFDKQFQRAQYQLDGNVMNSMVPFMPMITEMLDKGAVVALPYGVEGFATPKHLVKEDGSQAQMSTLYFFRMVFRIFTSRLVPR